MEINLAREVFKVMIMQAPLNHAVDISHTGFYKYFRVVYNFQDDKEGYDAYSWEVGTTIESMPYAYPLLYKQELRARVVVTFATEEQAKKSLTEYFFTKGKAAGRGSKGKIRLW